MHVSRPGYSAEIASLLGDFPAVALLGPRQCGKTTLARDFIDSRADGGIYLDLERPRDLARLADPDLFLSSYRDRLVCLDEVQRLPGLFPVLRSLIDDDPRSGRFLLLGSASPELVQQGAESLAGRLAMIDLSPLTYAEAVPAASDMETHWVRGGFPRSLLARDEAASVRWREEFIRSFLERDLGLLGIRTSPEAMGRFWRIIAHHHGQLLNLSTLANSLDVSHPTVRARVDEMVGAFMLRLLPPFTSNLGKRLVKSPKVYVRDSGLLHALLDITDRHALFGHPAFGASWEGYVIEQALALARGWRASFFRTASGLELDLVLERGNRRIAFECKASSAPTVAKGFWTALEDLGIEEAYLVAPIAEPWPLEKRVRVIAPGELAAILA
jgi:predicted AAA+ superfamily ATPase